MEVFSEMTTVHEPIFKVLSDDLFTDRENILAILKKIAYGAKYQRFFSPVLIGHRRMGKTEVLKKLYNGFETGLIASPLEKIALSEVVATVPCARRLLWWDQNSLQILPAYRERHPRSFGRLGP